MHGTPALDSGPLASSVVAEVLAHVGGVESGHLPITRPVEQLVRSRLVQRCGEEDRVESAVDVVRPVHGNDGEEVLRLEAQVGGRGEIVEPMLSHGLHARAIRPLVAVRIVSIQGDALVECSLVDDDSISDDLWGLSTAAHERSASEAQTNGVLVCCTRDGNPVSFGYQIGRGGICSPHISSDTSHLSSSSEVEGQGSVLLGGRRLKSITETALRIASGRHLHPLLLLGLTLSERKRRSESKDSKVEGSPQTIANTR